MPTITISGNTFEVYQTLTTANAYFAGAIQGSPWFAATSGTKNTALITAARVFDRTNWLGEPTEPIDNVNVPPDPGFQPLAWPRSGLTTRNGVVVDSATIPQDVLSANAEYALDLINDATVQTDDLRGTNLKIDESLQRVEGAITVQTKQEFFKSTIGRLPQFPTIVQQYIGLWLAGTNLITGLASGADQESTIEGVDFGFNVGGLL